MLMRKPWPLTKLFYRKETQFMDKEERNLNQELLGLKEEREIITFLKDLEICDD